MFTRRKDSTHRYDACLALIFSDGAFPMFFRNAIGAIGAITLSAACTILPQPTHELTTETPDYDANVSARIRILTGNGAGGAFFRPGEACYKGLFERDDNKVVVGDGFWSAWKYSSRSITIGMPASPRKWMTVDGLEFKDLIREYVVPAGKPLTVAMTVSSSAGNYHSSCTPPATTFAPEPGQDYDIFMNNEGRRCWVEVRRIDGHGIDELTVQKLAPKCDASPK
ncbi:hypothetical protein C9I56_24990 [Paraburkholderia caribensis]|jgi:hypothetical protein|nr:hypothetical protein C9I56_24990 [Paraburkholderia caribensis]